VTTNQAVLHALADPTRRAVFESLRHGPRAVGEIAGGLPVTRAAVSQHLRVLKDAGLVGETPQGTRRIYRIEPQGLAALRSWVEGFWADVLAAYAVEAARRAKQQRTQPNHRRDPR
jgi:DNA-binding transcriptional ArsR family regulator